MDYKSKSEVFHPECRFGMGEGGAVGGLRYSNTQIKSQEKFLKTVPRSETSREHLGVNWGFLTRFFSCQFSVLHHIIFLVTSSAPFQPTLSSTLFLSKKIFHATSFHRLFFHWTLLGYLWLFRETISLTFPAVLLDCWLATECNLHNQSLLSFHINSLPGSWLGCTRPWLRSVSSIIERNTIHNFNREYWNPSTPFISLLALFLLRCTG